VCGICGFASFHGESVEHILKGMTDTLAHRGPDDSDTWVERHDGVGLGHRRLSILDLSPLGRQPMESHCERYVIAYNGEVYNHLRLREDLQDYPFKSSSDTETILAAISKWGLVDAVSRLVGMFAIALWDRESKTLNLVRDRLGIKPLYYGWSGGHFLFGSELKALRAFPEFDASLDRDALTLYFRHNYIPAPWTVYDNARKLEPGCMLSLKSGDLVPVVQQYWSSLDVWNTGAENPFVGTFDAALDDLDELLSDAVSIRMLSDVPLGALLSGGIDSSMVVALMQKVSSRPVKTFSIGFHEEVYNEARHAKVVANSLGTDHTELYMTPKDMLDVIPHIPKYWDEPFSDSSQIPTYCVSHLTREHVTVALSGDGGDELFVGYSRYFWMDRWKNVEKMPLAMRRGMKNVLKLVPPQFIAALGALGHKLHWRLDMLGIETFDDFYRYFLSHNQRPESLVLGAREKVSPMTREYDFHFSDTFRKMTFWDVMAYLPDDILTKTDRASMAHGLELRVPLLDHRVVEFASSLPMEMKVVGNSGKHILKELLYRYVPREIVDRPKMGFGIPVQEWLETDLREWCHDMLNSDRIRAQGILNVDEIEMMLKKFRNGETMWCHQLWDVLMFQAWLEEWH
jgi:asparagine synthase (glutamine-hydrolysing)